MKILSIFSVSFNLILFWSTKRGNKILKFFKIFFSQFKSLPNINVSIFSGATTGTGGRIRDMQAVGRGGYCIAGTAGYSVGNLLIPGLLLLYSLNLIKYLTI